jgi:hypothetical protein
MVRKHQSVDGSLDLLLDTITNTFGSVLFMTMLVAILLRTAGIVRETTAPMSKTDQARAEARVTELTVDVERLRAKLDALPPADPHLARLEAEITKAAEDTARALAEDAAVAAEAAADQERAADLVRRMVEAREKLELLKPLAEEQAGRRRQAEERAAELAKAAIELDRPVDPSRITQTARLPELMATKKDQFGIVIRYGRIYVMHERGPNGERLGPNTQHFVVTSQPDGRQAAQARPDAGYIADGATVKKTMGDILRRYPANAWVVAVIVHEDSFAQFQTVKSALVDLGYQYEPIVVRKKGGVWDSGGTTARGQ